MQQHKWIEMFVARATWFLAAMMILVIMALPAVAQAQQPASNTSATRNASVTLVERESFARVYAGIVEGLAPEAFERCVRWGQGCPTPRVVQDELLSRATLRTLRRLRVYRDATAPGIIAKQLQEAGALSARCLMDTTVGSVIERSWVRVRFRTRDLARHPWNLRSWFSHRCRDRMIDVRPGRQIVYIAYPREAEQRVTTAVQTVVGTPNNPPTLEMLRTAAHALLATLSPDDSPDIPTAALIAALRAFAHAVTEMRLSVVKVPDPPSAVQQPPAEGFPWLLFILASLAAMCALGLVVQRHYYVGVIADMEEESDGKIVSIEVDAARVLADAERDAFTRGREEEAAATEKKYKPIDFIAGIVATKVMGPLPTPGSGEASPSGFDRLVTAWERWNDYVTGIHRQGQEVGEQRALTATDDALREAMKVFGIVFEGPRERPLHPDTLGFLMRDALKALHGAHTENIAIVRELHQTQLARKEGCLTLDIEKVRQLAHFLGLVMETLPTTDNRRNTAMNDENILLIATGVLEVLIERAARATDLAAMEARLTAALGKMVDQIEGLVEKMDPTQRFPTENSTSLDDVIQRANARLETLVLVS